MELDFKEESINNGWELAAIQLSDQKTKENPEMIKAISGLMETLIRIN